MGLYYRQRAFWALACAALDAVGMEFSALLLANSNSRQPKDMHFDSCSELSMRISNDNDFISALRTAIEGGKSSFDVSFESDRDLFGAIHSIQFDITSIEYGNDGIHYTVNASDRYDFTEFKIDYMRNGLFNAIAWIGNDMAYIDMQYVGALNEFGVYIQVEGILP